MKNKILGVVIGLLFIGCNRSPEYSTDPKVVSRGETVFKTYCISCHDLKNDGIAPALGSATKSADSEWLTSFIKNPSEMINSGDQRAKVLFSQYKAYMPGFNFLTDDQIYAVLSYIDLNSDVNTKTLTSNNSAAAIALPKGDSIREGNLTLAIEDFVTIPSSSDHPPLARIANMRVRPGSARDEIYVNDQRGFIYFIKGGKVTEFFSIRDHIDAFIVSPGIGTGLGSFAFHPDFENNGLLYITHAEKYNGIPGDNAFSDSVAVRMQWVLSEWKMDGSDSGRFSGSRRELLRVNFPTHSHGFQDMNFMEGIPESHPEYGLLYLGIGDGGSVESGILELSHHLGSPLGTILRIDPLGSNSRNGKYGVPTTNPFFSAQEPGTWKEIWAYGFRNPHRLEWTSAGELIVADVGQHSFEELNLVVPGTDYGWYQREGDHHLDVEQIKAAYAMDDYGAEYGMPLAQYDHYIGSAICGGYVYTGQIESLRDKYVFGDIVNGKIFYLKLPFEREYLNPIYGVQLFYRGSISDMMAITGTGRVDLRFGEDRNRDLYIMTKSDAKIRKVVGVKD